MIPLELTPAQAAALDDLLHNLDLIGAQPLQCEIDWALQSASSVGAAVGARSA